MTKDEALDLALEALKELVAQTEARLFAVKHDHVALQNARQAITAIKQARSAQQEPVCIYPRCSCNSKDFCDPKRQQALDKKAENARELGLDYEPVWDNLPSNKDVEDAMRMKRLNQLSNPPAAQPAPVQEPVAWINAEKRTFEWNGPVLWNTPTVAVLDKIPLYTTPPAAAPVQEPVAEVIQADTENYKIHIIKPQPAGTKLYTAPPAQPMGWLEILRNNRTATDEVIGAFLRGHAEHLTGETFVLTTPPAAQPAPVQEPVPKNFMDALRFDVAARDAREWARVDMLEHAEGNLGIGTAQPEPVQEAFWHAVVSEQAPVVDKAIRRLDVAEEYAAQCRPYYPGVEVVPLYRAAPPAAQPAVPLTDEQRRAIIAKLSEADYADGDEWDNALFDAIEAAHGITGETK